MTQAELGRPYLSRAAVSSIEKGHSIPSLPSLAHIAKQLHLAARDLLPN